MALLKRLFSLYAAGMTMPSLKSRPRLLLSAAFGFLVWFFAPSLRPATHVLVAWDAAIGLYLMLAARMMATSDHHKIRFRAQQQDEGGTLILLLITLSAIASLAAIVAELATAKEYHGSLKGMHIALAGLTVFLSWAFLHSMYALHYAHEYYRPRDGALAHGLQFPGHMEQPDYWDFMYYAFIIGTACATADISITSASMRKVTTMHCVVAFFFNTTILALTVNIGAGLF